MASDPISIVQLDPASAGATELVKVLEKSGQVELFVAPTPEEATQLAQQFAPCILVISILDGDTGDPQVATLKKLEKTIRSGALKTLVFTEVKKHAALAKVAELGVTDLIQEPVQARALAFKANLAAKAVMAARKRAGKGGDDTVVIRAKEGEAKAEGASSAVRSHYKPALQLGEDTFVFRKAPPKKIGRKIVLEAEGPDPSTGRWVPEGGKASGGKRAWRWVPNEENGEDKREGWVHEGDEPTFDEKTSQWQLRSEKPSLTFRRNGKVEATKVETDDDDNVSIAEDSPAAFHNLKMNRARVAERKMKELSGRLEGAEIDAGDGVKTLKSRAKPPGKAADGEAEEGEAKDEAGGEAASLPEGEDDEERAALRQKAERVARERRRGKGSLGVGDETESDALSDEAAGLDEAGEAGEAKSARAEITRTKAKAGGSGGTEGEAKEESAMARRMPGDGAGSAPEPGDLRNGGEPGGEAAAKRRLEKTKAIAAEKERARNAGENRAEEEAAGEAAGEEVDSEERKRRLTRATGLPEKKKRADTPRARAEERVRELAREDAEDLAEEEAERRRRLERRAEKAEKEGLPPESMPLDEEDALARRRSQQRAERRAARKKERAAIEDSLEGKGRALHDMFPEEEAGGEDEIPRVAGAEERERNFRAIESLEEAGADLLWGEGERRKKEKKKPGESPRNEESGEAPVLVPRAEIEPLAGSWEECDGVWAYLGNEAFADGIAALEEVLPIWIYEGEPEPILTPSEAHWSFARQGPRRVEKADDLPQAVREMLENLADQGSLAGGRPGEGKVAPAAEELPWFQEREKGRRSPKGPNARDEAVADSSADQGASRANGSAAADATENDSRDEPGAREKAARSEGSPEGEANKGVEDAQKDAAAMERERPESSAEEISARTPGLGAGAKAEGESGEPPSPERTAANEPVPEEETSSGASPEATGTPAGAGSGAAAALPEGFRLNTQELFTFVVISDIFQSGRSAGQKREEALLALRPHFREPPAWAGEGLSVPNPSEREKHLLNRFTPVVRGLFGEDGAGNQEKAA